MKIIYFHGSPGVFEECDNLMKILTQYEFVPFDKNENTTLKENVVLLGYSWGNVSAFRFANQNINYVKGIIILSPYIFPSQNSVIKIFFSIPFLWKFALKLAGERIITNMLVKTSSPQTPPENYKKLIPQLSDPDRLQTSILEKENINLENLKQIANSKIPIALIYGEKDQTSQQAEQVLPIKKILTISVDVEIKNAGHALLFTHTKEVAKIIKQFLL